MFSRARHRRRARAISNLRYFLGRLDLSFNDDDEAALFRGCCSGRVRGGCLPRACEELVLRKRFACRDGRLKGVLAASFRSCYESPVRDDLSIAANQESDL